MAKAIIADSAARLDPDRSIPTRFAPLHCGRVGVVRLGAVA